MDHFKTFSAVLLAAVVVMALAGTASATVVTSPAGAAYTGTFSATSTNGQLHGSFITTSCGHSLFEGKIESHGASQTAEGKISKLTFTNCNYTMTVRKGGSWIFHATGGGSGTLTWTGAEFALHTSIGECVFTTSATDIGTVTGGIGAVLDVNSSSIPRTGGSFFCGSSLTWTANYQFTTPSALLVD
jgi:hypothetical protein